jgi:3-oxocholest-4-en-26-oate---CoA ligase
VSRFNLADLWEAVTDAAPDRVALRYGGGQRTFAELEERGNRLAHWLIDGGVQPGVAAGRDGSR